MTTTKMPIKSTVLGGVRSWMPISASLLPWKVFSPLPSPTTIPGRPLFQKTVAFERHKPGVVGKLLVISRNTGRGNDAHASRAKLLEDGLASAGSYCAAFDIKLDTPPIVVAFNGFRSVYPAVSNIQEATGSNIHDREQRKIVEAVASTPTGIRCMILVRGLDGWTSNIASLRKFGEAFAHIDLWFVSSVPRSWEHSSAWVLEPNGVRYNTVSFRDIVSYVSGSSAPVTGDAQELVKILAYIDKEKLSQRGGAVAWLTRCRATVE